MNGRLILHGSLLCLPLLAAVCAAVFFYVDRVPEIEKNEGRRVVSEYRAVALGLKGDPAAAAFSREQAHKSAGKMSPGKWGHFPATEAGDRTVVWYADAARCVATTVETEFAFDFRTFFTLAGGAAILLLGVVTAAGLRFFVGYVKTRDDFMSATAHDLATPLVGMRYAIGRNDDDVKMLNERLIRIVGNIKDFLRLGGRRIPKREPFDLAAAYREAYALFRDDFRDLYDGADVEVAGAEEPVPAVGDETMVVQVIWNLLGNDLKYAAPHGRVSVAFSCEGGRARVTFVDEGPGMTARERRRVFDRYYRAKNVLASGKGGFGIGLCTAREFARAMGGDLTVCARGKGSAFILELPAAENTTPVISSTAGRCRAG